jgi:hypothetical protein
LQHDDEDDDDQQELAAEEAKGKVTLPYHIHL